MDTTTVVIGTVAVGAAWILGRTDRPTYRRDVRRQEHTAARLNTVALNGHLADADAALGRVQLLADRMRPDLPGVAAQLDAAISGRPAQVEVSA